MLPLVLEIRHIGRDPNPRFSHLADTKLFLKYLTKKLNVPFLAFWMEFRGASAQNWVLAVLSTKTNKLKSKNLKLPCIGHPDTVFFRFGRMKPFLHHHSLTLDSSRTYRSFSNKSKFIF